jgi:hypothetical protein
MTVNVRRPGEIALEGRCGVEDAEALQRHLLAAPTATVTWDTCEHLHAAVLQLLLVAKPRLLGVPSSPFLASHIAPLVQSSTQLDAGTGMARQSPQSVKPPGGKQ